jgi:transposase
MDVISVGIDVSKQKSMVTAMRFPAETIIEPFEIKHTKTDLSDFVASLKKLNGELRVVMESTGHYHLPLVDALYEAGIFVSVVPPQLICNFKKIAMRQAKTDKQDAITLARYGLKYWLDLRPYSPTEFLRQRLKECSRQYYIYTNAKVKLKTYLIALLDQTFPGSNQFFKADIKTDGREKWVDFVAAFYHCECVNRMTKEEFRKVYREWCRQNEYYDNEDKAYFIHEQSLKYAPNLPNDPHNEFRVKDVAGRVTILSQGAEIYRAEMQRLASRLPEYPVVSKMFGAGKTLAPLLMAEIGDVRRFTHGRALVAYAGIDPGSNQSGQYRKASVPISRNGSKRFRAVLYKVIMCYVRSKPDDPVYQFYLKKRSEGKLYYVSLVAAANKFLRMYYARVKKYLDEVEGHS